MTVHRCTTTTGLFLIAAIGAAAELRCQFPGITLYGTATAGCLGTATIGGNSAPTLGNAGFALNCQGAYPLAAGLIALSSAPQIPPVAIGGAAIWVNLANAVLLLAPISIGGSATVPQPIPSTPSLINTSWYAQFGWFEPGPGCPAGGFVLASTRALEFTIQPCGVDPGEPNNSSTQATAVGAGTISRLLCPAGDVDWYGFSVAGKSVMAATLVPPGGRNYDLELRSATASIATSANGGSATESIVRCLTAGSYFLRAYGAAGAWDPIVPYSLSLGLTTYTPAPGQTITAGNAPFASATWHPTLRNFNFLGPGAGPCSDTVTITISGTFANTCVTPTASIEWYDNNLPFPQTVAVQVLAGASGSFNLSYTFQAPPGSSFGFGLYVSGMTAFCPMSITSGTMTVTRS